MLMSPFDTVRIGPFRAAHHQMQVDDAFCRHLDLYLRTELLAQVTIEYAATEGALLAAFDENRFCGPNSLVKNLYKLEICFRAATSSEEIRTSLIYTPPTFLVQHNQPLYLWTVSRKRQAQNAEMEIRLLCDQIGAGTIDGACCPLCGTSIQITDEDAIFNVACSSGCFKYNFHRDPITREFLHGHFFLKKPD